MVFKNSWNEKCFHSDELPVSMLFHPMNLLSVHLSIWSSFSHRS